jgi:hypothetical protein
MFARSIDGGQSFGANIQVDRNTGILPALALDDSGGIHIAWCNYNAAGNEFTYYAKSTDGGLSFLPPVRACESLYQRQPSWVSIAVSRSGRHVYVARQEYSRILLSRPTDGGVTFITPDTRVNSDTATPMQNPSVAVFADSIVLVAWQDDIASPNGCDVWCSRSTDAGASFFPELLLNDTAGNTHYQTDPSIAVDATGRVYAAWKNGPGWYLGFTVSDDTGATFRHEVGVPGSYGGGYPSLWAAQDGRLYLTWRIFAGDHDVRFAYSPNRGDTFYRPVNPSDDSVGAEQGWATVTASSAGKVFIAWADNRCNPSSINDDIFFATGVPAAIGEQPVSREPAVGLDVSSSITRGSIAFEFSLPLASIVRVEVADLLGRRLRLLEDRFLLRGTYHRLWDGRDGQGKRVRNGVYYLRLVAGGDALSRKVVLMSE